MSIKAKSTTEQGQGLVETLIAVSVAIIVVTALISLAVFALRNSRQSSYVAQATQIAQNQLELIRTYRDTPATTWANFADMSVGGSLISTCTFNTTERCNFSDDLDLDPQLNTSTSPFTYYFSLECVSGVNTCTSSGGTVRAHVFVTWDVGGRQENIYNNSDYTNWRLK